MPDQLLSLCANAVFDKKGFDIVALDVTEMVDYTDHFLLASGRSPQHIKALWSNLVTRAREAGFEALSVEGEQHNRWVLVDFGLLMVHLFVDELRGLYDLERLWADSKRVDLGLPPTPHPILSDSDDDDLEFE